MRIFDIFIVFDCFCGAYERLFWNIFSICINVERYEEGGRLLRI